MGEAKEGDPCSSFVVLFLGFWHGTELSELRFGIWVGRRAGYTNRYGRPRDDQ